MDPGGQLDIQQLFAAAAQVQSQLMSAQQQLAETEIEGSAGGGLVKVTINGQGELVDVTIAKRGHRARRSCRDRVHARRPDARRLPRRVPGPRRRAGRDDGPARGRVRRSGSRRRWPARSAWPARLPWPSRPAGRAGPAAAAGERRCPTTGPDRARSEVYEGVVQDLIDELGQLPGVGPKGAQRIAFHLLTANAEDVRRLGDHADRGTGEGQVLPHLRQRGRE